MSCSMQRDKVPPKGIAVQVSCGNGVGMPLLAAFCDSPAARRTRAAWRAAQADARCAPCNCTMLQTLPCGIFFGHGTFMPTGGAL